ncbi:MAG: hypothetical protein S4CHLAM6_13370 [Chlamydiae bacterium]|nr:hypothetical protein [Chlamydiota bacterium]
MKFLKKSASLLAIAVCFSTTLFSDTLIDAEELNSISSELIYIQQAKVAELSHNPDRPGTYLLRVSGSDKTLVYFSDKPDRVAGTLTLAHFVKTWQNSTALKESLPNAVISYMEFKATTDTGVGADILQLSNPEYNAGTDTVTFVAKPLHEYDIMTGVFENLVIVYDGIESLDATCEAIR